MKYTPLHVHSHYSLLDGLAKLDDLITKAKEENMPALALTDHGVMFGAIEFYQKCKKAGIKPIIGVEAYIVDDLKVKSSDTEERFHLILLAENNEGYKNLIKLTTIAHLEGFYYKPRIDFETLKKYSKGLICTSACMQGEVGRSVLKGKPDDYIKKVINKYQKIFGENNYFLEVQHHPNLPDQKKVNDKIFELGKELNIPIVATNDTHYVNSDDAEAHDILICLQTKKTINDTNRMSYLGEDFSLYSCEQMADNFRGNLEVLENTNKIAERCNIEISLGEIQLPYYELPKGESDISHLRKMCNDGVAKRFGFKVDDKDLDESQKNILARLDYELSIIEKTGYPSYFLIVQDFINWAKEQGIMVGPGRGSAAGSLVSYLINITNLDPIKYDLLFERFLNPARISMPDIDIDFADERRDEVLKYTERKYGKDHVSQIITFGTMAARAAVKDVGRVLEIPYTFNDQLSKLIPMGMKLADTLAQVQEFKQLYNSNPDAKRIVDFALKLEGVARHASTHACGVVITKKSLDNYCPTQFSRDKEDAIVTQYSLHPIEDLGLLKMDFLGLKNLTIMERACEIIEKIHNIKIDLDNLPLADEKAFSLFQEGKTTGVFQFESSGMKKYLKQLKPNELEDLIAMVSLYRPGPMDLIPDFIDRKHGFKKIEYVHPKLESSLAKTFGIAIYQEQIMQIARDLAGFSLGEADVLRKAVGKKKIDLLAEQKEKFLKGCEETGVGRKVGADVFAFIEPFAGYGFNRSHAACYAFVAYQTAYLKANYPAEFMAALLTSDQHNMERISIEIDECKNMGLTVLPPNINESFSTFSVVAEKVGTLNTKIRFGLNAIRNVGENVAKNIIHERKQNGQYKDLEDFLSRMNSKDINKKSLEGLIKSGAFDMFGERNILFENTEKMLLFVREIEQEKLSNQASLFSLAKNDQNIQAKLILNQETDITQAQMLAWEREFLGLYVSDHPFKNFINELKPFTTSFKTVKTFLGETKTVRMAGIVSTIKKIMTKKGDPMLFVTLEDGIEILEVLVFPKVYQENQTIWQEEAILVVEGTTSDKDEEIKILVNKVWQLNDENKVEILNQLRETPYAENKVNKWKQNNALSESSAKVIINYPTGATKDFAEKIKMVFVSLPGRHKVYLKINNNIVKTNFRINPLGENLDKLETVFGLNNIKVI